MRREPSVLIVVALLCGATLAACASQESAAPAPSTSSASPSTTTTTDPSPTATTGTATTTPSATPTTTRQPIAASISGLHVAGVQDGAWPDSNVPVGSLRLWDSGTSWSQIETTKGRYDWAQLDESVANAESHGVDDILLVLGTTPAWNAKRIDAADYPAPGAASAPRDIDAWDRFVAAVAKRYAGRITSYQVWNEASLSMFWDGTPEQMADLTERAYRIIKDIDPGATVVAASTTVRLEGAFDRFFTGYLEALKVRDWPVDVLAVHLYPASREDTDARAEFIAQVRETLTAVQAPDLPLWDTELNYGLAGPGPTNPRQSIEGSRARDWVVQTTMDSLALGIARTYWYIWTPEPYPLLGMQLTNNSGAVKGLRVVDQWLVGGELLGCTEEAGLASCDVTRSGVPARIVWSIDGPAALAPPAGFSEVCRTDNTCVPITGAIELDETPVRLLP